MKENLNINREQWLTLKLFAEKNPWPNESTLRNLYYKGKANGLEAAFRKVGRRILVHEGIFFDLIKNKK